MERSSIESIVTKIGASRVDPELRSILNDIALCLAQLAAESRPRDPYRERIRRAGLRHLERVDGRRAR